MNRKVFRILICFVLAILFAGSGYVLIKYSKQKTSVESVYYKETGTVDYEVCLKENEFISSKCLTKDSDEDTYIASLINYLNLKYSYDIKFDKEFSGSYEYYFKATIKADTGDEADQGHYLKEEYVLTDKVKKEFSDVDSLALNEDIKIDYNEYNDFLNKFKNTYSLIVDSKLVVSLEIAINFTDDTMDREVSKNVSIPVSVPLTTQVVEIPITASSINNKSLIYSNERVHSVTNYYIYRAAGYASFVLSFVFILLIMILGAKYVKIVSEYKKQLRKIMRLYDGVIVNVKKAPKLGAGVIYVESFSELIDAHSEVRKPINFVESSKGALFYLASEGNTWAFKLEKTDDDE